MGFNLCLNRFLFKIQNIILNKNNKFYYKEELYFIIFVLVLF